MTEYITVLIKQLKIIVLKIQSCFYIELKLLKMMLISVFGLFVHFTLTLSRQYNLKKN